MKETTRKLIVWAGLAVALLCTVLSVIFAGKNGGVSVLEEVQAGGLFDATFYILLALIAISVVAIIGYALVKIAKRMASDKKYLVRFLIVLAAIVVVCIVAYVASSGTDVSPAMMDKYGATEGTSKLIGAACIAVYILVIVAALAIVWTSVSKLIKK